MCPAGPRGLGTNHPGSHEGHFGGTSRSLHPKQSSPESTPKSNGCWAGHSNAHPFPEWKSSGMEPPVTPAFDSFSPDSFPPKRF